MPEGRVLALDLGEARIGVALSDPERTVALPHGTIRVAGGVDDLKAVAALVDETGAVEVVIGHPLSLTGRRGPAATRAEAFAEGLGLTLEVPVRLQDERLSTKEAERQLRAAGAPSKDLRQRVDETAATLILRTFLELHGPNRNPPSGR